MQGKSHHIGIGAPDTFDKGSSLTLDGIAFNVDREIWPNPNVRWVELAYKLDVNEYQGRESVQLMVAHLAPR